MQLTGFQIFEPNLKPCSESNLTIILNKMKQLKHLQLFILTLILIQFQLRAQENIPASGGNGSTAGGSVSYSVGHVSFNTHSSSTFSVSEGVQQPIEISVVDVTENRIQYISLQVFPNPTSLYLNLVIENIDLTQVEYQLFDMQGKLLLSSSITSNHTILDLTPFAQSVYILKIMNENLSFKTFQIIKNI
jgi:hypothetical protein